MASERTRLDADVWELAQQVSDLYKLDSPRKAIEMMVRMKAPEMLGNFPKEQSKPIETIPRPIARPTSSPAFITTSAADNAFDDLLGDLAA